MLRLTLRSGKDGRFLARIVDSGGHPFVLDFGDRRIIDDARQRLLHGFTMWRFGQLINAAPQDAEILTNLAEFYCGEGLLVSLEEPTWPGRDSTLDERVPAPASDAEVFAQPAAPSPPPLVPIPVADLGPRDATSDESTDIVNLDDMTDLGDLLEEGTREEPAPDELDDDEATEIAGDRPPTKS